MSLLSLLAFGLLTAGTAVFLAATVYGVGKTFLWPTMLGVVGERFPRGGALTMGTIGGIGMLSAGLLGGPGIGYKQDYFAVQRITSLSKDSYDRYVSRDDQGNLSESGFPILTKLLPKELPPVAGLDNGKLKVFDDYGNVLAGQAKSTTLASDLETLQKVKAEGGKVEPKLESELTGLMKWWSKPASRERRRSSSRPQPLSAIRTTSAPLGIRRIRRATSKPSMPGNPMSSIFRLCTARSLRTLGYTLHSAPGSLACRRTRRRTLRGPSYT